MFTMHKLHKCVEPIVWARMRFPYDIWNGDEMEKNIGVKFETTEY